MGAHGLGPVNLRVIPGDGGISLSTVELLEGDETVVLGEFVKVGENPHARPE
jgi:hypothetical protein